jgi:hypothetical protein
MLKFSTMEKKFRVEWYLDDVYIVLCQETNLVKHQGSLSDCESYIRLVEGGYLKN